MPDIALPDIHLPEIKLPDGLRDMNRRDIQKAFDDRVPNKFEMPDVDLSNVDIPKAVAAGRDRVGKAIDKIELPKAVEDRMPGRKRSNPILPIAALLAVGSMCAAAWWLITSPTATQRVRETADRLRSKVMGMRSDLQRYDDDENLGSLLPEPDETRPSVQSDTWPETTADIGEAITTGNGSSTRPAGV